MSNQEVIAEVEKAAAEIGTGWSLRDCIDKLYWELEARGFKTCLLNERYLIVNGNEFQFIRKHSLGHYVAKCFKVAA